MNRRGAGRRAGDPAVTRQAILDAARSVFGQLGFEKGSLRAIASAAGVDPALALHYFGSKEDLFVAAMRVPADPRAVLAAAFAHGPVEELGERLVRAVLGVWDSPAGARAVPVMRLALSSERLGGAVREFMRGRIVAAVADHLPAEVDQHELRATLVASQIVGLAATRYVLRFDPLASADTEVVVRAVAPTVQRYLTGSIG